MNTIAMAAPSKWLKALVKDIKAAGYYVAADYPSGMVVGYIDKGDKTPVFRAFEHTRGHWYVKAADGMLTTTGDSHA